MKTNFNSALRLTLGAFRTTPIRNLIFEADTMTIEQHRDFATAKLFKSIMFNDRYPVSKVLNKSLNQKKIPKIPSTLSRIIQFSKKLNLPFNTIQPSLNKSPNWTINLSTIDTSLNENKKSSTDNTIYQQRFNEIQHKLNDHSFLYTDGSRTENGVSYGVVDNVKILINSILPEYSTNYSAEIIAIYETIKLIKNSTGRHIICTDSLSALDAIKNLNNDQFYPNMIRQTIIERQPDIKLIWLPGHSGIKGNESADSCAKTALSAPLITTPNLSSDDILNFLRFKFREEKLQNWIQTTDWYKKINPKKLNANSIFKNIDNNILPRKDQIKITRLRLGHTLTSHSHIMDKNLSKLCPFCGFNPISIDHLFSNCPHMNKFDNNIINKTNFFQIIDTSMTKDIVKLIISYLKQCNLYNSI